MIRSNNYYKILGILIVVLNVLPICNALYLLYMYNFTTRLYIYMYPIYFLVGILTLGLIGIACGVLIIRGKNKPLKYVVTGFLTVLINIILFFI